MLTLRHARRGFTLIELLVVVAIIVILAATLFPVFAQARSKARQAQCLSNLKQIGTAMLIYTQDYDETLPMANYRGQGDNVTWQYLIDPYVKADFPNLVSSTANKKLSIYVCPEFPRTADGATSNRPSSSYGANAWVLAAFDGNRPQSSWGSVVSLASIQYPANLVLLAPHRGNCVWTEGDDRNHGQSGSIPSCNRGYVVARARHGEGANYLLSDGHARWFRSPSPYNQESRTVVRQRSINPNAAAWFRED